LTVGVGIDLVEVARLARALANHGSRFEARVYTPGELGDCAGRADRILALAARFAAKEACLKALGTGWASGIGFRQIEVARDPHGRPSLRLHGEAAARARAIGVARCHVSLSHQPTVAAAVVVLDGAPER
jgi:holo-[acyl-carrier protein] synthase